MNVGQKNQVCKKVIPYSVVGIGRQKMELVKNEDIDQAEWYKSLINNLLDIWGHYNITVIETLQQCYWEIGAQINQAKEYFHEAGIEADDTILQCIARGTGKSQRTLYYAIKLNETFKKPEDIPTMPWNKLIKQYLTEPKQIESKHICQWEDFNLEKCKICGNTRKKGG